MKTLTPQDAIDIYERCHQGDKQRTIAIDYDVSQATVSGIKRGYYWNRVTGAERTRPLSPHQEQTVAIYNAYWEDKLPVKEIAARFGVSKNCVYDVRKGVTGAHLTGHPIDGSTK